MLASLVITSRTSGAVAEGGQRDASAGQYLAVASFTDGPQYDRGNSPMFAPVPGRDRTIEVDLQMGQVGPAKDGIVAGGGGEGVTLVDLTGGKKGNPPGHAGPALCLLPCAIRMRVPYRDRLWPPSDAVGGPEGPFPVAKKGSQGLAREECAA